MSNSDNKDKANNASSTSQNPQFTPLFEGIRRVNLQGQEYWSARELLPVLGYSGWQRATAVLDRAMGACQETGNPVADHFNASVKLIEAGKGATREIEDYHLSRFGAYLVAQNCDPRGRPQVAAAQVYFAVKTRQKELAELRQDQERRVLLRERVSEVNNLLADAAHNAGVSSTNFPIFQDEGYKGLYGGLGVREIKHKKGISTKDEVLDRMGREELAANEFRITQTEAKLRRESIEGEQTAINTHREIGQGVRKTIAEFGGTMPEELAPEPNIKPIIEERQKARRKVAAQKAKPQLAMTMFEEAGDEGATNKENTTPEEGS
jgi:DNA-damage-inducible protein D